MKQYKDLKELRLDLGLRQKDIAEILSVKRQYVFSIEKTGKLPYKHKKKLEEIYNCKISLDATESNKNNDIIELEHICIRPECGNGVELYEEPYIEPFRISRQSITTYLRCSNPNNLKTFQATGDSMEEKISDGDWLLVDIGRKDISISGIYIFSANGKYRCKRLHVTLDGKLHIKSDNPKYQEEVYSPEDNIEINIIGRVLINLSKGV